MCQHLDNSRELSRPPGHQFLTILVSPLVGPPPSEPTMNKKDLSMSLCLGWIKIYCTTLPG